MRKSQNTKILNWLLKGYTLTPLVALNKFGSFRLSARIKNLRDDGYPIETKRVSKGGKSFASYKINEEYKPL